MLKICTICLLMAGGLLTASDDWQIYWRAEPGTDDPFTLTLWNFGQNTSAFLEEEGLDDLLADDGPAAAFEGQRNEERYKLNGEAAITQDGRFGPGLRLLPGGSITGANPIRLEAMRQHRGATIDWWIKRERGATGVILTLTGASPLQVLLGDDGTLTVRQGDRPLLQHGRSLPAGEWVHIGLLLGETGGLRVSVFGTTEAAEESVRLNGIGGQIVFSAGSAPVTIDAVRVRRQQWRFYERHDAWLDPELSRPWVEGPPYFASLLEPTLALSFDGTAQPQRFTGTNVEGKAAAEAFVPGIRGQALDLSHPSAATLAYAGLDGVAPERGTLECWIRPIDWDNYKAGDYRGTNLSWQRLLRIAQADDPVYRGLRMLAIREGWAAQENGKLLIPIHPGHWHHLLITWEGNARKVYINGRPQPFNHAWWRGPAHIFDREAFDAWKERTDGKQDGTYRLLLGPSPTWIDELRIYPWAMKPAEAANAFARLLPDAEERLVPLPAVEAEFDYFAHSWDDVEKLRATLVCLPVDGVVPVRAEAVLRAAGGEELGRQASELNDAGIATPEFVRPLDFGDYELAVTLFAADGEALITRTLPYTRERPDWYENTLGLDRRVPKPWTPMTVAERTIGVWGRTVELGEDGLPVRIDAVGEALLAAPMRLHGSTGDGSDFELAGEGVTFSERAEDRVAWQGQMASEPLRASVDGWMEYDGLMYLTITLRNPGAAPLRIARFQVDVPMPAATASQLICNSGGPNFRASYDVRMIPDGEGSVWSTLSKESMQRGLTIGSFCPHIWVGGDRAGLTFSGENDQGWTPEADGPAQEILRDGDRVIYRMNIIAQPVEIAESRQFHVIITPTPTKPMPEGWRGWNRMPPQIPLAKYDVIDDFIGFPLKAEAGNSTGLNFAMEPVSWEDAETQAASIHEKFGDHHPLFLYMDYSWPRLGPSFADWNHDLWAGSGRMDWTQPEVEDYMVHIINEYLERDLIQGIYVDDVSVGRTYSLAGTAYPLPGYDPPRRRGFVFMGFRRFCQRIWKLMEARGQQPHILPHMTMCFEMPAFTHVTSMVNGEHRMINLADKPDTMDRWPKEQLRIMGNGEKWGVATFWKPTVEVTGGVPPLMESWYYRQTRTLHANILQHDMWYLWHYPSANNILPSLMAFGMDDPELTFVPYWENDLVTSNAEESVVGIFRKAGKALVMVSNYAREDRPLRLTVDPVKLFGRQVEVRWKDADCCLEAPEDPAAAGQPTLPDADGNAEETLADLEDMLEGRDPVEEAKARMAIEPDGNHLDLTVRARDYRLILLEPAP